MRVLEVLPTYPGDPFDGSAVYERQLNRALIERGTHVEVLTTRARRLEHRRTFSITWPDDLPDRDMHDGVQIRRFHAIDTERFGRTASDAVVRRWSREDVRDGVVLARSTRFIEASAVQARRRPWHVDMLADLGRGPVVPGLIAHLARRVSEFDVVLTGYAPFSLPRQVLWIASLSRLPVVLLPFIHENDRYHHFNSLLRTYEQAAAVLTLSPHTSDFLREHVPGSNPIAVGAGATLALTGTSSAAQFRAEHDLRDRPLFLFVGRKELGKRYDLAVEAVDMLPADAVLLIVGRDVDGRHIESDRVRHLGTLSDAALAAAYEACDVFIFPSEFESFGMVILDAWLRAKPVIGNVACGAAVSLIDDGLDGFLCRDAQQIAAAAARLIEDPDLRARMGAAGRSKTLADYTWDRVAERALIAFQSITRERS